MPALTPEEFEKRIQNWAQAYRDRYRYSCSAMFRQYRPERDPDVKPPPMAACIDMRDADAVQAAWLLLEERDRMLISWTRIMRANDHIVIRKANRAQAGTIVRLHDLNAYIKLAEERLSMSLSLLNHKKRVKYEKDRIAVSAQL